MRNTFFDTADKNKEDSSETANTATTWNKHLFSLKTKSTWLQKQGQIV